MKLHSYRLRSLSKWSAQVIISSCLAVLILEIIVRFGAFIWFGYDRFYIYYGLQELFGQGIFRTMGKDDGYFKFPPNYLLRGLRGQASETASINSLGFRGPEFDPAKRDNVFRVICMGESSTFGFSNHDDATYPSLLRQLLQDGTAAKVEVINAGFPYYNSANILALLEKELLSYKPDLLTLYAGANDSGWPLEVSRIGGIVALLHQRSMIFLSLDGFANKLQSTRIFQRITRTIANLVSQRLDLTAIDADIDKIALRYKDNVKTIISIAKKSGVPIVLIKQPMTADHKQSVFVTYEEEYRMLLSEAQSQRALSIKEIMLLRHHRLMAELETMAREEHVPVVDNIAIVDRDRRRLVSWVHLTGEANLRLAEALKYVIGSYIGEKYDFRQPKPGYPASFINNAG